MELLTQASSNLLTLIEIVSKAELPRDDYEHHTFLRANAIPKAAPSYSKFNSLLDYYVTESNSKRRGAAQLAEFRRHWQYVLLCLSQCFFMRRWLCFRLDSAAYGSNGDYWIKKYKLSRDLTKEIIAYLDCNGLVDCRLGKAYKKGDPMSTRVFPRAVLAAELLEFFLDIEQPIQPPYVTANDAEGKWHRIINLSLPKDHPDKVGMTRINDFLKGHKWACKAPVRLVYNTDAFHGGRLITPFQSLSDRSMRVRINTLIDGQPIAEVDFNANHLRLALAVLSNEYAGETPYEDIAEAAKVEGRDTVKAFITVAMGAGSEKEAANACGLKGIPRDTFVRLRDGARKRFPNLPLFESWGVVAQNLEGAILKDVMLQGVDRGIVCLPVHDAIAIPQGNEEWALDVMQEAWQKTTGGINTRLKIDRA